MIVSKKSQVLVLTLAVLSWAPVSLAAEGEYSVKTFPVESGTGNVEAALERPVSVEAAPLQEWFGAWSDQADIPVTLDVPSLKEAGIAADATIDLTLEQVSARSALDLVLAHLGLAYTIDDGRIRIVGPQGLWEDLSTRIYRVDLPSDEQTLVMLVTALVEPDSWSFVGGNATLAVLEDTLIVTTTDAIHHRIEELLEALATVANAESEDRVIYLAEEAETERRAIEKALATRAAVEAGDYRLRSLVLELAGAAGVPLVINPRALDHLGIGVEVEVHVPPGDLSVGEVLERMHPDLAPVIRSEVVQITSADAARHDLQTAVFDVTGLAVREVPHPHSLETEPFIGKRDAWNVENLARLITGTVAPSRWDAVGGSSSIMAVSEPECIVVSSTDHILAEIRNLLDALRAAGAPTADDSEERAPSLPDGYTRAVFAANDVEEAAELRDVISKIIAPQTWAFKSDASIGVTGQLIVLQNRREFVEEAIELAERIQKAKNARRSGFGN